MDKADAVLDRFLEPVQQSLTPEQARRLVDFCADPATQQHIDELARKANEGQLRGCEKKGTVPFNIAKTSPFQGSKGDSPLFFTPSELF